MNTFFIADLHFGHENIIKFDHRPFNSAEEMDEELIKRWNNKVSKGDLVYSLGDMFWKSQEYAYNILKRLNGSIILIKGNHDKWLHNANNKSLLSGIKDYDEINVDDKKLILSHYYIPMYNSHYHGSIMLHGHTHNTAEHLAELEMQKLLNNKGMINQVYNVGCMLNYMNYTPRTLDEIINWKGKL